MNNDNMWMALATFGRVRVQIGDLPTGMTVTEFRDMLNEEAVKEGVSLRINTIASSDWMLKALDISLRKYA